MIVSISKGNKKIIITTTTRLKNLDAAFFIELSSPLKAAFAKSIIPNTIKNPIKVYLINPKTSSRNKTNKLPQIPHPEISEI